MERRSFIGSVLGLVASLGVPLRVERAEFETDTPLAQLKLLVRALEMPESLLHRFRCGLVLDSGEVIALHHVEAVERDPERLCVSFRFRQVLMSQQITLCGLVLIDDRGREVRRKSVQSTTVVPGDTLTTSYDVNCTLA